MNEGRQKFIETQGDRFLDMSIEDFEKNLPYTNEKSGEKLNETLDIIFKAMHFAIAKRLGY